MINCPYKPMVGSGCATLNYNSTGIIYISQKISLKIFLYRKLYNFVRSNVVKFYDLNIVVISAHRKVFRLCRRYACFKQIGIDASFRFFRQPMSEQQPQPPQPMSEQQPPPNLSSLVEVDQQPKCLPRRTSRLAIWFLPK